MNITANLPIYKNLKESNLIDKSKNNIAFGAGLTSQLLSEINNSNPLINDTLVSRMLKSQSTGFKEDKFAAKFVLWTKCIFEKLQLPLPPSVHLVDFNKDASLQGCAGLCAHTPTYLALGKIWDFRTVFLNSQIPWENINEHMDKLYAMRQKSTNHFLRIPIHEFSHNVHLKHLKDKFGIVSPLVVNAELQEVFSTAKKQSIRGALGEYATTNPAELFAEALTKEITDCLDGNLNPTKHPKHFEGRVEQLVKDSWQGKVGTIGRLLGHVF